MGAFSVGCRIENVVDRKRGAALSRILVDIGSEYTWVPSGLLERIGVTREKKTWSS